MTSEIIMDQMQRTPRDFVEDIVSNMFISDYGIVSAVNSDGTVDVQHAIIRTLKAGGDLGVTTTKNIEVMWPASAQLSIKAKLAVGDKVWLVGMKNYIDTLDIEQPKEQSVYYSYSRETLKAVPVSLFDASSKVQVVVEDGELKVTADAIAIEAANGASLDAKSGTVAIKNTAQSLKTLLDTLIDDLTTMSSTPAVSGAPIYAPGAAQWPALKALFDALLS